MRSPGKHESFCEMKFVQTLILALSFSLTTCQPAEWTPVAGGQLTVQQSANSPFPHSRRNAGHTYSDSLYRFEEHYNDSSVAIFVPDHFIPGKTIDLVFYFHGWGNSIQKSLENFDLLNQFSASHKNAIFVFPEGPKNAPDSFGGKLEEKDVFKALVGDVLNFLKHEKKIDTTTPGKIILSGHSGAYRVISFILNRGGLSDQISEVYLFDALYAGEAKYAHWLTQYQGRFVNIVTPDGGTYGESENFLNNLEDWGVPFQRYDKNDVSLSELRQEKVVTIFTSLGHSEVIDPYFGWCLKTSALTNSD